MAFRFDQCIFDVLAKLGKGALQSLVEFLKSKVALLQREIKKLFSLVDLLDSTLEDLEAAIQDIANMLNIKQMVSNLLGAATDISPACGDIALVFQGPSNLAQSTATYAEHKLYEARQLLASKNKMKETQKAFDEQVNSLNGIISVVQQFGEEAITDTTGFLQGAVHPLNEIISTGFQEVNDQADRINSKLKGLI